jgi:hypothetical protein
MDWPGGAGNSGFVELSGVFQRRKGKPEAMVGQARTVKKCRKLDAPQAHAGFAVP